MGMGGLHTKLNLGSVQRLILCLFICVLLFHPIQSISDTDRLDQLNAASQRSSIGVITLTESSFRKYVESTPRGYSLFVLLTADARLCKACPTLKQILGRIAKEYNTLPSKKQGSYPVFFAALELSQESESIMTDYGVSTVPILYHFAAGKTKKYPSQLRSSDQYDGGLHINPIKTFINRKAGSKFRVVRGGYTIPFAPFVRAAVPLITVLFAALGLCVVTWNLYLSPYFWLTVVVGVYMFSLGGGHFSWIHNTPWAVVSQEGVFNWIEQGSSRSQYVAEGFCFAVLCVSIAAIILIIQELPKYVESKSTQRALGWPLIIILYLLVLVLYSLYEFKSPGYLRHSDL